MALNFEDALYLVKGGVRVARKHWDRSCIQLSTDTTFNSFLVFVSESDGMSPWTPSHFDLLANDWVVVDYPF